MDGWKFSGQGILSDFCQVDVLVEDLFLVDEVVFIMIAVDVKLLYEFIVVYLVSWLPLLEGNKICSLQISSMVPVLVEPIRYTLQ